MRKKNAMRQNMFTQVGWLFADMFLAMTMIFLSTSTIGTYTPPQSKATPTPHQVGLDPHPQDVSMTVDMNALLNGDADSYVQQQVKAQLASYLHSHPYGKAAVVLTFGGGPQNDIDTQEAQDTNAILQHMGSQQHYVFNHSDISYNNFIDLGSDYGAIYIEIFFFLYTT